MVNVRALPTAKVPAVIVTVNTRVVASMAAEPAGVLVAPAVKVRAPPPTMASPAPLSVMTILPVAGIKVVGVRVTDMVTPPAPLAALLRVIAGWFVPRVLVMMATEEPVLLTSMITSAEVVEAAAMMADEP